jgi:hypothetical protein
VCVRVRSAVLTGRQSNGIYPMVFGVVQRVKRVNSCFALVNASAPIASSAENVGVVLCCVVWCCVVLWAAVGGVAGSLELHTADCRVPMLFLACNISRALLQTCNLVLSTPSRSALPKSRSQRRRCQRAAHRDGHRVMPRPYCWAVASKLSVSCGWAQPAG